jgi:hypothetical protein
MALALILALAPAPVSGQAPHGPAALPTFTIFGWVSPPVSETTAERFAQLAGAGMNVATSAWDDPHKRDVNLRRLDLAARAGVRCFVVDDRFDRIEMLGGLDTSAGRALLDSIVADYRDHPGFLGYSFADEPRSNMFPALAKVFAELRKRDPDHPAWENLGGIRMFGDSALWVANNTGYVERVHPAVLCNDHYDFRNGFDYGEFVMNAAALRSWSLAYGIPFWSIIQLVPHANVRPLTEGELAWQVSMLLAYGASGLGYFTYWTPAPDPALNWGPAIITYDGVPTPWYDVVARMNRLAQPAGETLVGLTWLSTQHAGSRPRGGETFRGDDWLTRVDGRAAVGRFVDASGVPYLLVVNSDSLAPRTVTLTLVGATGVSRLATAREDWRPLAIESLVSGARVALDLSAGEFALLRLEGTFGGGVAPLTPTLAVIPSPAAVEVRFAVTRLAGDARVEILDVAGRQVWLRRLPAGRASLVWRGELDAGGEAPAGVYITRVSDARGTASRRWAWLGTP